MIKVHLVKEVIIVELIDAKIFCLRFPVNFITLDYPFLERFETVVPFLLCFLSIL